MSIAVSLWYLLTDGPLVVAGSDVFDHGLGGAATWSAVLVSLAAGGIVGSLAIVRLLGDRRGRPLVVTSLALALGSGLPLGIALRLPVPAIAALAVVAGIAMAALNVTYATFIQLDVPGELLSRVSAIDEVGSSVLQPLGLALSGPVVAALGAGPTLVGAAVAGAVICAAAASFPAVRALRQSEVSPRPADAEPSASSHNLVEEGR
jgi:hypothetical protein